MGATAQQSHVGGWANKALKRKRMDQIEGRLQAELGWNHLSFDICQGG